VIPIEDVERWRFYLASGYRYPPPWPPTLHAERELLVEMIEDRLELDKESANERIEELEYELEGMKTQLKACHLQLEDL